jgi:menaquinone-9 beta-reductase
MTGQRFDVAIVGAGPGGSATAHYLAQRGARVALIDKAAFPRDKTCGDGLTPRAVAVLQDMGLTERLAPNSQTIRRFEVVAPNRRRTVAGIPGTQTLPDFAWVVPRLALDDAIRQRALDSGAVYFAESQVDDIAIATGQASVRFTHAGQTEAIQARHVVIATGANTALLVKLAILNAQPPTMVAARAYFEGLRDLEDTWQLRFDGVPLPGYGWIFPTGPGAANIGAGFYAHKRAGSAAETFKHFVANPALRAMLSSARQISPMKGYPLRCDFARAPTHGERVLLVGEAAGLVNPLTGEGIDYALESGRIAAAHLSRMLQGDGDTAQARASYDADLRAHFQSLFEFCELVRDRLCDKAWLLNVLVGVANRRPALRSKLALVVLGGKAIQGKLTLGRLARAALRV